MLADTLVSPLFCKQSQHMLVFLIKNLFVLVLRFPRNPIINTNKNLGKAQEIYEYVLN